MDGDGLDDLYVMERYGRNQLLRNRGDGTFEDVAAAVGLDVDGHTSSAVFADFDNDGDQDALLGRTLERSSLLVNESGRFVDRSAELAAPLPYLVSSVAAADYDGDGLLDVYLSTYASAMLLSEFLDRMKELGPVEIMKVRPKLLAEYLSAEDAQHLFDLVSTGDAHIFRDAPGPPNLLLHNDGGGRFSPSPEMRLFRHTYQSTWADYDGDGDPDLYCANDFAPNNLYRNEGGGRFTDVTEQTGTADIGFGMGADWGDYNNDGRQDLYVSNMYSKAGRRVTEQVPGLDPRFAQMARGNSLFRNAPDRFEKVSGVEPDKLQVENAGWAWGGQFADLDNDGWLDLYSLSGHYTPPKELEVPVDL